METWKPLGPGNIGAAFDKQLAQDRSVASPLVVAIASHRKIGPMGERGQEIEELSSVRRLHFRPELPLKRDPRFFVVRSFSFFQKPLTRREIGQPNIVKIALGIFRLRHSPGWSANGADPQTLLSLARRTKPYDGDCHDVSYQGSFAPGTSSTWKSEEVPADAAELSIQEAGISRESESSARFVQSNRRDFQDMDVVRGVRSSG